MIVEKMLDHFNVQTMWYFAKCVFLERSFQTPSVVLARPNQGPDTSCVNISYTHSLSPPFSKIVAYRCFTKPMIKATSERVQTIAEEHVELWSTAGTFDVQEAASSTFSWEKTGSAGSTPNQLGLLILVSGKSRIQAKQVWELMHGVKIFPCLCNQVSSTWELKHRMYPEAHTKPTNVTNINTPTNTDRLIKDTNAV